MSRIIVAVLAWTGLWAPVAAQPVAPNNYSVALYATGIGANGASMAVDADGFLYIVDRLISPSFAGDTVTLVTPTGVVTNGFIANIGSISQLAMNPTDGRVYAGVSSPGLPVVLSTIYRLSPTAGAVPVDTTALIVDGFTIDDQGDWIFGASTAVGLPGLYRQTPGSSNPVYLGPGFGSNSILQSLALSSDVLIGDANEVRRWTPAAVAPLPYASYLQLPNSIVRVNSIARSAFDQLGRGALVGVRELTTVCLCGTGLAYPGSPTTGSNTPLVTENYVLPEDGMVAIATSVRGPLFWLTDQPPVTPFPGRNIYVVVENEGPGIIPTLQVNVTGTASGSSVTANLWGPPGGRVLLGAIAAPSINPGLELYSPFGWVLNVFDPSYLPVVDGPGAFGPPDPTGVVPNSGAWQWSINLPPVGISIATQALVQSASTAPNGWFHISSLQPVFLP